MRSELINLRKGAISLRMIPAPPTLRGDAASQLRAPYSKRVVVPGANRAFFFGLEIVSHIPDFPERGDTLSPRIERVLYTDFFQCRSFRKSKDRT